MTEAQEATEATEAAVQPGPIEELASEIGWRPDGELSAAEFIKNGPEIQKRQRVSNERLDAELRAQKEMLHRISSTIEGVQERAMAKARAELMAEKQAAFEGGDYQRFQQIEAEERQLVQKPAQSPAIAEFVARNEWLKTDPILRSAAIRMDADIRAAAPNMGEAEVLEKVAAEVKAAYPHKFRDKAKTSPDLDTRPPGAKQTTGRKNGFSELPSEAQAIALKLERQGLGSRDEYATRYWSSDK